VKKINNKIHNNSNKYISMVALVMSMSMMTACGQATTTTIDAEAQDSSITEKDRAENVAVENKSENTEEKNEEAVDSEDTETTELIVFAAASMTETLTELKETYETEHPEIEIIYNFDSSGTLKTQIQEGAACDLFISAGQKQMNQLDITADPEVNTEGLDFVDEMTRVDILENKVTLCVPDDNPKGLTSFDELSEAFESGDFLFCMGNSDVPVGQYTQKVFEYYGLDEETLASEGLITYGTNVKEVTTQISEGSVDAGVIYCTDAYSAGLNIVDYATADMCGQVIYPAAVLKTAENAEQAQEFLDFIQTDESMAVFEEVGFSRVN
jgi:molybdate transport system substrate-binding protein